MTKTSGKTRPREKYAEAPSTYYEDLRINSQLCFALYSATNKLVRLYSGLLQPVGLTFPQCLVMMVLWEKSPSLVGEVAEALDLDNGTVTPVLKRLEASGFVRRVRDVADERCVHAYVTAKGLAVKKQIIALRHDLECKVAVDEDEIALLRETLKRFSGVLDRATSH